jgi:hypothetical protein
MAEEKKPKIDLKARLGKAGGGAGAANQAAAVPPPAISPGGIPMPAPAGSSGNNAALPQSSPSPKVPVPGVPVGPPPAFRAPAAALDPSNPLAAAIGQAQQPAPRAVSARPPQPQRIEVDEMAVQEARKGARKQGLIAGLVAAVVLGAVGFIAGGANETSKGRATSVAHAKSLAQDVQKAREQLKNLADKVDAGRTTLGKDHKFPDTLGKELGGINIDFDGTKLAGVRFSGFSTETTSGLIEFITAVQQINDRKLATINLLTHLQKPITEQLAAGNKLSIGYVVLLGKRDPSNNPFAILAPLTKPIDVASPTQISLPAEFAATDPTSGSNVTAPKYATGSLDKPSAVYVVPKSVQSACPSETAGQIGQLVGQLGRFVNDVRGEQAAPGGDVVTENKPGLLERADKLIAGLNKVQ